MVSLDGIEFSESGKLYKFKLVVSNTENKITNRDYEFTIETTFKNSPPKFSGVISPQILTAGKDASWSLPRLTDPEGDQIQSINVKIGAEAAWVNFDLSTMKFDVKGSDFKPKLGTSNVKIPIVITDAFGASSSFEQQIFIKAPTPESTESDSAESKEVGSAGKNSTATNSTDTNATNSTATNSTDTKATNTIS